MAKITNIDYLFTHLLKYFSRLFQVLLFYIFIFRNEIIKATKIGILTTLE